MKQYLDIVKTVLDEGVRKKNRTGIDALSCFSLNFRHDLANGFPLLTTKKMSGRLWNSLVHELLWFISGENHIRNFGKKSHIWDSWADEDGDLETAYGFYWRNFPYAFDGTMADEELAYQRDWLASCDNEMGVGHFDQLGWIINELKTNSNSRRMVCTAWEPANAHKSKLPPCHFVWVVNVQDGRLNLQWIMRSCDLFLGLPFNIASYALLCHMLAKESGLEPGILSGCLIDAHIYCADEDDETPVVANPATGETLPRSEFDHTQAAKKQLKREPYILPTIKIVDKPMSELEFNDFKIVGYKSHPRIKARIAI